ncbi:MAG: hypothetical protein QOF77_681 [Solirubrobacteraceae bacterium]|nr:hypothetical protein [Solirubrobacteraceae bacterium]
MSDSESFPLPEQMHEGTAALVALVRRQLPMRFYAGETWWSIFGSASLARMCDTVESLLDLLAARRDADAQEMVRSLYEQVVAFGWIAIDPDERHQRWIDDAGAQMFALHQEGLAFGETVLTEDEVVVAEAAERLPPMIERAAEVDEYWGRRAPRLHTGEALSFRHLHLTIYRVGSGTTLESYITPRERRIVVDRAREKTLAWYAFAAPLLAMALVIASQRFVWLDDDEVRAISDRATACAQVAE